jgi:hypothetical protein
MFHNNGGVTNLKENFVFEFEDSLVDDDEGGVDGLNCTPTW